MSSDKQATNPQAAKGGDKGVTNPHKKQIYVWPQNLEFFMSLPNKSRTINLLIQKYKEEIQDADGAEIKS